MIAKDCFRRKIEEIRAPSKESATDKPKIWWCSSHGLPHMQRLSEQMSGSALQIERSLRPRTVWEQCDQAAIVIFASNLYCFTSWWCTGMQKA